MLELIVHFGAIFARVGVGGGHNKKIVVSVPLQPKLGVCLAKLKKFRVREPRNQWSSQNHGAKHQVYLLRRASS